MRWIWVILAGAAPALLAPAPTLAHGIVGRTDLPIPQWLFGWAAALVLGASFAALATLWPRPRFERPRLRRVVSLGSVADVPAGALGVFIFTAVVYSGLAGTHSTAANLAPTFVYVVLWVGVPVASLAVGDFFRLFSPWRAIARAARWVAERFGEPMPAPLAYPQRLGRWPAALTILAFTWLELAYVGRGEDPSLLAALAIAYMLVQLAGMSLFGIETWSGRGDGFGVLFSFVASLSPWRRRDGALQLRPPLAGAAAIDPIPGTVALLCTAIGTTAFDGFSQGSAWNATVSALRSAFSALGSGETASVQLALTVGLVGCVLVIAGLYHLGVAGMRSGDGKRSTAQLAAAYAHSLIPIAAAYSLAHYFSLLVYQGQAVAFLVSDPLGTGSDFFGTADAAIDYGVIGATTIWYVQVGALVTGHVAGLVLAHDRAVGLYSDAAEATRSQYWMLLVMVAFTSLGLWLLSAVTA